MDRVVQLVNSADDPTIQSSGKEAEEVVHSDSDSSSASVEDVAEQDGSFGDLDE